jgi:hypothetical protein
MPPPLVPQAKTVRLSFRPTDFSSQQSCAVAPGSIQEDARFASQLGVGSTPAPRLLYIPNQQQEKSQQQQQKRLHESEKK